MYLFLMLWIFILTYFFFLLLITIQNTSNNNRWAGSICELDIMYQLEQVHFLLDEMVQNGYIAETNKQNILRPLDLMEREAQKAESMYR